MAIPVSIDALVNRRVVESNRIEFKCYFNPDPLIRSICAFANDIDNMGGGHIIVGVVEENGAPKFHVAGIAQERIDGIQKNCASIIMPSGRSISRWSNRFCIKMRMCLLSGFPATLAVRTKYRGRLRASSIIISARSPVA